MVKECEEEACIPPGLADQARPVGTVRCLIFLFFYFYTTIQVKSLKIVYNLLRSTKAIANGLILRCMLQFFSIQNLSQIPG